MKHPFGYKAWANGEMLAAVARIDATSHPEQRRAAIRVLNHTWVVDRIFAAHLAGESHGYTATNTEQTPELDELAEAIRGSDRWYLDYVASVTPAQLAETVHFQFTDGQKGAMTRTEMLFHVLAHGANHRGNIGMILNDCGVSRPKETFARYLHAAEPERRLASSEA